MAGKEALLRQWEEREVELARMGRYESRWAFIIFTGSSLQPQGWAGSIPVPPSPCSWYPSAWTTPWLCPTPPVIPCIIPAIATSWLSNLSLFPILSPGDSWTLWGRAGDGEDLRGLPQRKSWPQEVGQKPSRDQCSLERYNLPPLCIKIIYSHSKGQSATISVSFLCHQQQSLLLIKYLPMIGESAEKLQPKKDRGGSELRLLGMVKWSDEEAREICGVRVGGYHLKQDSEGWTEENKELKWAVKGIQKVN